MYNKKASFLSQQSQVVFFFKKLSHYTRIDFFSWNCFITTAFPDMKEEDTSYFLTIAEDSFFGGTLPVRSQFLWVLLVLLQNPGYVSKCQKEIDSVLGAYKNVKPFFFAAITILRLKLYWNFILEKKLVIKNNRLLLRY